MHAHSILFSFLFGTFTSMPLTRTHYSVLPLIFRYAQFCPPLLVSLIEMPFFAVTVRSKVFDCPEKIAKKSKKIETLWDRRYSCLQGVYQFSCRLDTLGARGKGKHKFCTYVNSKFEKKRKKIKKYEILWD